MIENPKIITSTNKQTNKQTLSYCTDDMHFVFNTTVCNKSFENVSNLKYLGITVERRNKLHGEIRRRRNLRNDLLLFCLKFLSFYLLSKMLKISIYKAVIFHLFCMGFKHVSLTLRKEYITGV